MKIVEMEPHLLKPYPNNPRNNDEAVEAVANSIQAFGFKVPIIVDKDNTIIAGHTRWKAAGMLGLETVPVIKADDLTEEQVKAFRLADNKVGEAATWDFDKLAAELEEIDGIDMEQFGFTGEDAEPDETETDGGEIEDNNKARIAVKIMFPDVKAWRANETRIREMIDGIDGVTVSVGKDEDNEGNI